MKTKPNGYAKYFTLISNVSTDPKSVYDLADLLGLSPKQTRRLVEELIQVEPEKFQLTKVGRADAIKLKD